MLMTFEGMLVKQRLRSLSMLRAMRRPPILVYVYRELKWSVITSDLLIPGDIISITSTRLSVPANSTNSIDRKSQKGKCS
jgi:cation-transporting ATPase 13A1